MPSLQQHLDELSKETGLHCILLTFTKDGMPVAPGEVAEQVNVHASGRGMTREAVIDCLRSALRGMEALGD